MNDSKAVLSYECEQYCQVCGKKFIGPLWNCHGSLDYIIHDNFAFNIRLIFLRHSEGTIQEYANEFINIMDKETSHLEEFIECFLHYDADDTLKREIVKRVRMIMESGNVRLS